MVQEATVDQAPGAQATMRTLIVDDNPLLRETLRAMVEGFGATVTEAADGNQALCAIAAAALPFDVIVCDLRMPNRDGIQFLRAMAERKLRAGVILISGHEEEVLAAAADIGRRQDLNIAGHLKKPFTRAALRRMFDDIAPPAEQPAAAASHIVVEEDDIRRALAAGEMSVVFQPKVDCASCRFVGVEALIRWQHPRLGDIPPTTFIPIAEIGDTIDALTAFVLREALKLHAALGPSAAATLPIAVNLSTRSMTRLDFADQLEALVSECQASAPAITFEVTESRLAENMAALLETCTRLRLMGFKLAIDDFGTGFSTLEQLRLLPVSELKIDRAFVAGAPEDGRVRHILEASLSLGARLGLACVCEGVETRAEWDLIHALGHHYAQGFFIASPLPAPEIAAWAQDWSARTAHGALT